MRQAWFDIGGSAGASATISTCGRYRYSLRRRWGSGLSLCVIMLNPSTADAVKDDPTVRRCVGFARREGWMGLEVVNLFAYRATSPKELKSSACPVGPGNDEAIRVACARAGRIVVAWGAHGSFMSRDKEVLESMTRKVWCLGTTKRGHPRHPLYLKSSQPLIRYARKTQKEANNADM